MDKVVTVGTEPTHIVVMVTTLVPGCSDMVLDISSSTILFRLRSRTLIEMVCKASIKRCTQMFLLII